MQSPPIVPLQATSDAGFGPAAVSLALCWGVLVIEALALAGLNVALLKEAGGGR